MDSWALHATENDLTVTVHNMPDWEIKSAVLQTCLLMWKSYKRSFGRRVDKCCEMWKLGRSNMLLQVTTDNAVNIVNAIHEADGLGHLPEMGCLTFFTEVPQTTIF